VEDIFAVTCPECDKRLKVRADLAGKKIRCKDCGHAFVAKAPPAPKKQPEARKPADVVKAPAGKAPASPPKSPADAEFDDRNPYGITTLDLTPRCPHCAAELESEDVVLCISCGYNLETREHMRMVKTVETTGEDQFLWLLPGIACVVGILFLIVTDAFWLWILPAMVEDDDVFWILVWPPVTLWLIIASLFAMFFMGRFAIRRLILAPTAPEKEK
jgi:predicted Zn finger-like uncharacterized protein